MLTWAERKERRQLKRELARIEKNPARNRNLTAEERASQASEYWTAREFIDYRLWEIESNRLRRWAEKLAIDDPDERDESGAKAGYYFLPLNARNALRRAIRNEQRETAKFWWSMLMPLLSLIVALAAILAN